MPSFIDLTGRIFGRLTVLKQSQNISGRVAWTCQCECGNQKNALSKKLLNGKALSCGCKSREWVSSFGGNFVDKAMLTVRKHNHAANYQRTPEYSVWASMKQRCNNPKSTGWEKYGGKGIKVCQAWDENFVSFLSDMGNKPSPNYTIDRLNPLGDYEPGNCRWATKQQQGQENKTILKPLIFEGISYPSIAAACRAARVNMQSVRRRLWRGVSEDMVFDGLSRK